MRLRTERTLLGGLLFIYAALLGLPIFAQIGSGVGVSSPIGPGANTFIGTQTIDDGDNTLALTSRTITSTHDIAGGHSFDLDAPVSDGTSNSLVRIGRNTSTTGVHSVVFFRGNGANNQFFNATYDNTAGTTALTVGGVDMSPSGGSTTSLAVAGCSTTQTFELSYLRIGDWVTVDGSVDNNGDCTSNANTYAITTSSFLPAPSTAATAKQCGVGVNNTSTNVLILCSVNSAGNIDLLTSTQPNLTAGWTASGTKGFNGGSVRNERLHFSYRVN